MRVLVTGGAGFIGTNFIRMLRRERADWVVTNLDALTYAGNRQSLADEERGWDTYQFVKGDVRDPDIVRQLVAEIDAIINFAAESHVDRSIHDASGFVSTNIDGVRNLLDAIRFVRPQARFVQIGTDEVYGDLPIERTDLRFTEATPLAPHSPYAASKAAADLLVLAYHHTHRIDSCITRCSNNFGPFQFPEKVIPLFTARLLDGLPVPLYGDGRNVRDWLHVEDHCEAILQVLEAGRSGEVYNIGGDNECSNLALTHELLRLTGRDETFIQRTADRAGHDRRYAIDAQKIRRDLGWRPTRSSWPSALAMTVEWYRANEEWWRPLVERQTHSVNR